MYMDYSQWQKPAMYVITTSASNIMCVAEQYL